jgi:hypothetical protein
MPRSPADAACLTYKEIIGEKKDVYSVEYSLYRDIEGVI